MTKVGKCQHIVSIYLIGSMRSYTAILPFPASLVEVEQVRWSLLKVRGVSMRRYLVHGRFMPQLSIVDIVSSAFDVIDSAIPENGEWVFTAISIAAIEQF